MIDLPLSSSMLMAPRSVSLSAWLGHIPFASWLIEQLQPHLIVELGTHRGTSFLALCQAVQEQNLTSRVFAVDTWQGDEHAGFYGDDIYNELREYQQRNYAGISEMLRMRFNEALEYFANGSIDLLHIDGLHTYDAVREDFESWIPKLSDRAVVLFHDTCVRERGFGVWQYWSEISQQYPSFEFTHTHGLGVLLVGSRRVPKLLKLVDQSATGEFAPINRFFEVLGGNIKRAEEIERVYAGLADARGEVVHLGQAGKQLQDRCQQLEQAVVESQALQDRCQRAEQELQWLQQHRLQSEQEFQALQLRCQQAEQSLVTTPEALQRVVAQERVQAMEEILAKVLPRLQDNESKLDQLLRPWWRR